MNKNSQRLSAIAHGQLESFECKKGKNRKRITSKPEASVVSLLRFVVLDVVEVESCKEEAN